MTFSIYRASTGNTGVKKSFTTIAELKKYFDNQTIIIYWEDAEIWIYDDYME